MQPFTDKTAASYDDRIVKLIPGYALVHQLVPAVVSSFCNGESDILIAGAGTGVELINLATNNEHWSFTALDCSHGMLKLAKANFQASKFLNQVEYINQNLLDYRPERLHHAALSLFVVHFLPDADAKLQYFKSMRNCLAVGAPLIIADLTADKSNLLQGAYKEWLLSIGHTDEEANKVLDHIDTNFYPLDEEQLSFLLKEAGFKKPTVFFQSLCYSGYFTSL